MRFALIGDHPDGRAFAEAMCAAGHTLIASIGATGHSIEEILSPAFAEILANPDVDSVIVATPVKSRLDAVRRVLQSERHAIVVHPVDIKPDGAYELNMLQGDMHRVLLPLLPEAFIDLKLPPGAWCELTVSDPDEPLLHLDQTRRHPAFPGWTLLRRVAGEIQEVSAFGIDDFAQPGGVVLCSGKAELGLFHIRCHRAGDRRSMELRIVMPGTETRHDVSTWNDAWPKLVAEFARKIGQLPLTPRADPAAGAVDEPEARISWRDEVRALELNDAVARSLAKRRSVLMEYQEVSEEVGFKGTMTLIGCGMLWLIILFVILSVWIPWMLWAVLPTMIFFLGMQVLSVFAKNR